MPLAVPWQALRLGEQLREDVACVRGHALAVLVRVSGRDHRARLRWQADRLKVDLRELVAVGAVVELLVRALLRIRGDPL